MYRVDLCNVVEAVRVLCPCRTKRLISIMLNKGVNIELTSSRKPRHRVSGVSRVTRA